MGRKKTSKKSEAVKEEPKPPESKTTKEPRHWIW